MSDSLFSDLHSNVIDLDGYEFKKTFKNNCEHKHIEYDPSERSIECTDCGYEFDHFEAFCFMLQQYKSSALSMIRDRKEIKQIESKQLHLKAAKKAEEAWRSKSMVPTCPHCDEAIFAEDGFGGSMVNKEHAIQRREFMKKKKLSEIEKK